MCFTQHPNCSSKGSRGTPPQTPVLAQGGLLSASSPKLSRWCLQLWKEQEVLCFSQKVAPFRCAEQLKEREGKELSLPAECTAARGVRWPQKRAGLQRTHARRAALLEQCLQFVNPAFRCLPPLPSSLPQGTRALDSISPSACYRVEGAYHRRYTYHWFLFFTHS